MSRNVIKRTFIYVRLGAIQISLRIRAVRPESSLGAVWIAESATFLQADKNDSDQIVWTRRLI